MSTAPPTVHPPAHPIAHPTAHPVTTPHRAALYLAPHSREHRFKVGYSIRPLARLRQLPEAASGTLEWPRIRVIWLPDVRDARRVERGLHKLLAPYRLPPVHDGDGASEWFRDAAYMPALRVMRQLPGQESLRPTLLIEPPPRPTFDAWPWPEPIGLPLAEQWFGIEDLWERAARLMVLQLSADGQRQVLRWRHFRRLDHWEVRSRLVNAETYQLSGAQRTHAVVQLLELDGEDLLLTLVESKVLRRWPQAGELDAALQRFLHRIRSRPVGWLHAPAD